MRKLITVYALLLIAPLAADEKPVEWSLPNKSKNCEALYSFGEKGKCDVPGYQVWQCQQNKKKRSRATYLIVGHFTSDVSNTCSPTFVVDKVIPQARE